MIARMAALVPPLRPAGQVIFARPPIPGFTARPRAMTSPAAAPDRAFPPGSSRRRRCRARSPRRPGRVPADQPDAERPGRFTPSFIKRVQPLQPDSSRNPQRQQGPFRPAAHGRDIAQVDGQGFPAQIPAAHPVPDEMPVFEKHVRRHEQPFAFRPRHNGAVVADSLNAGRQLPDERPGHPGDESKLAQPVQPIRLPGRHASPPPRLSSLHLAPFAFPFVFRFRPLGRSSPLRSRRLDDRPQRPGCRGRTPRGADRRDDGFAVGPALRPGRVRP